MTQRLTFAVAGHPAPQGSKTAVVDKRGKVRQLEGRDAGQRARFTQWRGLVAQEAWLAMTRAKRTTPILGPVRVEILFVHPRPKSTTPGHRWRSKTPDVDKLARAVLDALGIAGVYGDDAQVADLHAAKVLAHDDEGSGAVITVTSLDHASAPGSVAELLPAPTGAQAALAAAQRAQRAAGRRR